MHVAVWFAMTDAKHKCIYDIVVLMYMSSLYIIYIIVSSNNIKSILIQQHGCAI